MLSLKNLLVAGALLSTACQAVTPKEKTAAAPTSIQQGPTWDKTISRGSKPTDPAKRLETAQAELATMQAGDSELPIDLHIAKIFVALQGVRSEEVKGLWSEVKEADIDAKLASLEKTVKSHEATVGEPSPRAQLVLAYFKAEASGIRPLVEGFHKKNAELIATIDSDAQLKKQIEGLGLKIEKEEKASRSRVRSCQGKTATTKLCQAEYATAAAGRKTPRASEETLYVDHAPVVLITLSRGDAQC